MNKMRITYNHIYSVQNILKVKENSFYPSIKN